MIHCSHPTLQLPNLILMILCQGRKCKTKRKTKFLEKFNDSDPSHSYESQDPQLPSLRRFASELMISPARFFPLDLPDTESNFCTEALHLQLGSTPKMFEDRANFHLHPRLGTRWYQCCQILDVKCEKLWRELTTQATQSL